MTMQKKKNDSKTVTKPDADEMPVIAWDEMSIMDTMRLAAQEDEATMIQVIAAKIDSGIANEDDFKELMRLRSSEYQYEQIEKKCASLAQYVRSVPDDWFKNGTPSERDYSDPQTYQALRPKKFFALYQMLLLNDGEAVTGN
ncbi:MAG: hypothetical protein AAFN11_14420 [Chloroflexota bacterium]